MATILQMVASLDAGSMSKTIDGLQVHAKELGDTLKSYNAKVDGKSAQATLLKMEVQADKLKDKLNYGLNIDGTQKAALELLGLETRAEALQKKLNMTAEIKVEDKTGLLTRLKDLVPGKGGGSKGVGGDLQDLLKNGIFGLNTGISGIGQAAGGAFAGIPSGVGIGSLGVLGALLAPAAVPLGLGGGLGFLGGILASGQKVKTVFSDMLKAIEQDLRPLRPLFDSVFGSLEKFISSPSFGASLRDIFATSVPFLKSFVGFLEQAAKVLLPAFSQTMREMIPFLPTIDKGLLIIVQGFAGFLRAMGPSGMKAAATLFVELARVIEVALTALGVASDYMVKRFVGNLHTLRDYWDTFRHETAVIFDGIRHDLAAWWDDVWNDAFKPVIHVVQDMENAFGAARKFLEAWALRIEIVFAGWAKNILHYAQDALGWLPGFLPGVSSMKRGLANAQTDLANFVRSTQNELHRLTDKHYTVGIGVSIPGSKNFVPGSTLGHKAVPGMAAGGTAASGWAWVGERGPELVHMSGGETVIPNHALRGYAAGTGAVTVHLSLPTLNAMARLFGGAVNSILSTFGAQAGGGSAPGFGVAPNGPVQAYARQLLSAYGWAAQWAQFNDIVMRESGWNPSATNPTSGAYGIPQALPPGKMASAGADWRTNPYTQLRWMMSYIRSAWGSPARADYNEVTQHWYDRGGWLMPGRTLAVNNTGRPERVLPPGHSSGALVHVDTMVVQDATNAALVASKLDFRIRASWSG